MSTRFGFAPRASRLTAVFVLVAVISAMFGGGSASAQPAAQVSAPAVNISLDGSSVASAETSALPLTPAAATSAPIASFDSQSVALGAPSEPGLAFGNPIGDFFGGLANKVLVMAKCAPVTPILIPFQVKDGDCIRLVQSAVGAALGPIGSAAMTAIFKEWNKAILALALFYVDFIVGTVLGGTNQPAITIPVIGTVGGSNKNLSAATDYQHGVGAPILTTSFFTTQFTMSQTVALYLLIPLFMLVVIQSIAKGSLFFLIRAFTIMLPCAILGGFFVVEFTRRLLWITDDICVAIASSITNAGNTDAQMKAFLATFSNYDFGLHEAFWFVLAGLAAIAIWLELLFREMGVYLAAFFLPLAFAGLVWPVTAKFTRRMVELLIALIFSKVIIVGSLSLGFAAMGFPSADTAATNATNQVSANQSAQNGPVANGLVSSATLDNLANPDATTPAEAVAGTVASGAPVDLSVKTGPVALDGSDQNDPQAMFNSWIVGVVITCFAIFSIMKLMEFAPGMDHIVGARLGNPGNIVNRGHVAAFGLTRLAGMLGSKKANMQPHGPNPQNNGSTGPKTPTTTPGKTPPALTSGPGGTSKAQQPALTTGPSGGSGGGGGAPIGGGSGGGAPSIPRTGGSGGRSQAGRAAPLALNDSRTISGETDTPPPKTGGREPGSDLPKPNGGGKRGGGSGGGGTPSTGSGGGGSK